MLKRVELHNHTTESDGSLNVRELIDFMIENKVGDMAITDHNTISGHNKAKKIIEDNKLQMDIIYGVEFTTYYGHILCLNMKEYIGWEDINYNNPERLFEKIKKSGALIGIAHPYSDGFPFAKGCKWEMNISDYSNLDFIEVFNNSQDLNKVNKKALELWESLILNGEDIAITTGMDLHGRRNMNGTFHTYINKEDNETIENALYKAIKNNNMHISRYGVLESFVNRQVDKVELRCKIRLIGDETEKINDEDILISIKGKNIDDTYKYKDDFSIVLDCNENYVKSPLIIKAYHKNKEMVNLLSLSPIIYI